MRLNFWQWIGIICVIVAIVFLARQETGAPPPTTNPTGTPAAR